MSRPFASAPDGRARSPAEQAFLAEINAGLPAGVDYKQGAISYLAEMVGDAGEPARWFHLTKPFRPGPDFGPFWVDVFTFLDVVHAVDLAPGSRVLDVGVGPGWTLQWLARLGHDVCGIDISADLLAIAAERMAADPHPPHHDRPFAYRLAEHDIEAAPVGLDEGADLVLFESTLHHFADPVAALRHAVADLAPGGLVAIIEAAAPPPGSSWDAENRALIERFATIERPYTRAQMHEMLGLAGLDWVEFYRPVNGLFTQDADGLAKMGFELGEADNLNICLAATNEEALARVRYRARSLAELRSGVELVDGFSELEVPAEGPAFRWCGTRGRVRVVGPGRHVLRVATIGLAGGDAQPVHVVTGGRVVGTVWLTGEEPTVDVALTAAGGGQLVELQSPRAFSPAWDGGDDTRVLSFRVEVPA